MCGTCGFPLPFAPMLPVRRRPATDPVGVWVSGWFLPHPWGSPYTVVFLSEADSLCADMEKQLRGGKRPVLWVMKFIPSPQFTGCVTFYKYLLLSRLPFCSANGLSTWLSEGSIARICPL